MPSGASTGTVLSTYVIAAGPLHSRPDGPPVERIFLGLQRTAGTLVRPGARVALRDDPAGARPRRGRQQVVGAPGPELVRGGELLVGIAEVPHARQRGHLVHDHLRRGGPHRRDHRLAIQPVENHRLGARRAQLRNLAGRPGGGGDLVTRRDQPRNKVPSQCPGRSRDENSHDLSFRSDSACLSHSAFREAGERTSASWPMSIDRHPATMVGNQQKEEEGRQ